jgi:hypothetical protein
MTGWTRMWRPVSTICLATLVLGCAGADAQYKRTPVERLAADLVPFIPDPMSSLVLAKVVRATWTPLPAEQKEEGVIELQVGETFRGAAPRAGESIEIAGKRMLDPTARARNNFDQWNNLPFEQGDQLVLALAPPPTGKRWSVLAANQVTGGNDPLVVGLRRALEIEAVKPGEAQIPALEQALAAPQPILRDYAIDAVARRTLVSRERGAEMIAHALEAPGLPADSQLPLVRELASPFFYRYALGADRVNVMVIESLAKLLVNGNRDDRGVWTQFLGSSLTIEFSKDPKRDQDLRMSIVRAVKEPPPGRVIDALEQQVAGGASDPRLAKLIEYWRAGAAQ